MVQGGDDNIIGVGPYLLERGVDQSSLTVAFGSMGWLYTDENKGSESHTTRPLKDIGFYKRKFVWYPPMGRYLCPLEFSSIDARINWMRKNSPPGDYERNIRSAVLEYAEWGPDVFNERARALINASKAKLSIHDLPEQWEVALLEVTSLTKYYL